jgi:hypothetical protein
LGQGAEAAFAAYRFVHQIKYKKEPALFAYFGDPEVSDTLSQRQDFPLHDDLVPVKLLHVCPLPELQPLWTTINGHSSLAELSQEHGTDDEELYSLINRLLKERALSFCPLK